MSKGVIQAVVMDQPYILKLTTKNQLLLPSILSNFDVYSTECTLLCTVVCVIHTITTLASHLETHQKKKRKMSDLSQ